jgi:hypothetical protein
MANPAGVRPVRSGAIFLDAPDRSQWEPLEPEAGYGTRGSLSTGVSRYYSFCGSLRGGLVLEFPTIYALTNGGSDNGNQDWN